MIIKKYIILLSIVFSFLLSGCLYSLGAFGSCDTWEIYSDQKNKASNFYIRVCAQKLGFNYSVLDRKTQKEIQNITYDKLTRLIKSEKSLKRCKIRKNSIMYQYGMPSEPLVADIICEKEIEFNRKVGRFFITSY